MGWLGSVFGWLAAGCRVRLVALQRPVDGVDAVAHQPGVGPGKVLAPEEPLVGGKGGGVGGFEHQVFGGVDQDLFFLRKFTPEHEYYILFEGRYFGDDGVGELGPANFSVAHGFVGPDRQRCVEEEDALFGPVG